MEIYNQVAKSSDDKPDTRKTWMRGLFMLLMIFAFGVGEALIVLVAIIQFLWILFAGQPNHNLLNFGRSLSKWIGDTTNYLTCVSEEKPFPWSEWPSSTK